MPNKISDMYVFGFASLIDGFRTKPKRIDFDALIRIIESMKPSSLSEILQSFNPQTIQDVVAVNIFMSDGTVIKPNVPRVTTSIPHNLCVVNQTTALESKSNGTWDRGTESRNGC